MAVSGLVVVANAIAAVVFFGWLLGIRLPFFLKAMRAVRELFLPSGKVTEAADAETKARQRLLAIAKQNSKPRFVRWRQDHPDFDVNCRLDDEGNTALIWACRHNARDVVELLLEHCGADSLMKNTRGRDALYYARRGRYFECQLMLADARAARAATSHKPPVANANLTLNASSALQQ